MAVPVPLVQLLPSDDDHDCGPLNPGTITRGTSTSSVDSLRPLRYSQDSGVGSDNGDYVSNMLQSPDDKNPLFPIPENQGISLKQDEETPR